MNKYEAEIPKYLKQKESNVSKAKKKSKHKHQYEECLIQYECNFGHKYIITSLKSYCTICGKIGDRFKKDKSIVKDYERTVDAPVEKCYQVMTSEELYEKYHNKLPVFFVEDICKEGYVNLEQLEIQKENNTLNKNTRRNYVLRNIFNGMFT